VRRCRNPKCGQYFAPPAGKDFWVYCSWPCRVAHVGEHYEDARGWQRERNQHYDRGYWAGVRSGPLNSTIPPGIWKGLLLFCHPDKWQGEPGLVTLATEVTRWLLEHRPPERH
jgi:hypothetical protein